MAIIRHVEDENIRYAYLNIFPDQFKTEKEKQNPGYIKNTMDYFSNKAYSEYIKNKNTFSKNYDLVKGILRLEDFHEDQDVKSFTDILQSTLDLPSYVQMYSIITTPLNELAGEVSKRPDLYKVKAYDDDSKSEELEYKTQLLQEFVISQIKQKLITKAKLSGEELGDEELQAKTMEQVKEELDGYTSVIEKWCNHVLVCHKADFGLKEKGEDAFRDLCISAREFFHIYEDNSKVGFNVEVLNPKNEWHLTTPDKKYISDPSGRANGAYAAGTVHVMELSEIIESIPDLTKEEIDHLRASLQDFGLINVRDSNLGNPKVGTGIDTINYDTYDPLVLQTRMVMESEMKDNSDPLKDFLGLTNNHSAFGYKYVVVRAYWISKVKIGKLVYLDEMGNEQTTIVDETYKSGNIPTEVELEWGWKNQWYQGIKIGPDIYHMKPLKILDYCPIIGTVFEQKNTEAKSLIDMMKPFQMLYNVAMNQLWDLLKKEIGNVASVSIRRVPRVKDGDGQDDIDVWELEARERGILFDDDSPENTKSPVANQTVARNVDLTRTAEIQSRYNLAVTLKNECWELIGMSKQRLGSISASESATGTNAAIQQSYSQTEPLFVAHEYVMGQLYQALLDATVYIESNKEYSTISYINSEGTSASIKIKGADLGLRDLKVFTTNRPEDTQMFNEMRQLSQAIIQNGGTLYDVIELYSTKSIREMKKTFKDLRDQQVAAQQHAQEMEQAKIEQADRIAQQQIQQTFQEKQMEMENDNHNKELDRLSNERIAIIKATGFGQVESEDKNVNGVPDVMELNKLVLEQDKLDKEHSSRMSEIVAKNREFDSKMAIEKDKLKVARENMANDLAIAKENAKAKKNSKS